jgi:hypothetical protein
MQMKPFGQHEMARLVQARWSQLTAADVEAAGKDRAALARIVARRYGVPVNRAKQEVRDFLRVVGPGKTPGGKRGRRAVERLDWNLESRDSIESGPGGDVRIDSDEAEERVESAIPGDLAGGIGTDPER